LTESIQSETTTLTFKKWLKRNLKEKWKTMNSICQKFQNTFKHLSQHGEITHLMRFLNNQVLHSDKGWVYVKNKYWTSLATQSNQVRIRTRTSKIKIRRKYREVFFKFKNVYFKKDMKLKIMRWNKWTWRVSRRKIFKWIKRQNKKMRIFYPTNQNQIFLSFKDQIYSFNKKLNHTTSSKEIQSISKTKTHAFLETSDHIICFLLWETNRKGWIIHISVLVFNPQVK
jgi:hypothetical protein